MIKDIKMSGKELGQEFLDLPANEQAEFFNTLGEMPTVTLTSILGKVSDSDTLEVEGSYAMRRIGEYSDSLPENKVDNQE
jgi:hypothetical protein